MNGSAPLVITLAKKEYDISTCDELARELEPTHMHPNVIVDMSDLRYLDSTCLGKLIHTRNERTARGFSPAVLVIGSEKIRHLFEIVKFDSLWPIYDSLDGALRDGARLETPTEAR